MGVAVIKNAYHNDRKLLKCINEVTEKQGTAIISCMLWLVHTSLH